MDMFFFSTNLLQFMTRQLPAPTDTAPNGHLLFLQRLLWFTATELSAVSTSAF